MRPSPNRAQEDQPGHVDRYVACVKFNPKKNATELCRRERGRGRLFLVGRLDQFIEAGKELCTGVVYAPFPELQKLPP